MRPCASFLGLALGVVLVGCREEPADHAEVAEGVVPDTNQPFTPPEIRRVWDSSRADVEPETSKVAAASDPPPSTAAATPPATPITPPAAPPPPAAKVAAPAPKPATAAPVNAPVVERSVPTDIVGPGETGEWTIQVGIHKSEEGARGMIAKLAAKGIPAYVVQAASNAGLSGSYWRVRVGRFVARSDAQKFGDKVLVPGGYSFWIDRKSNEAPVAGGTP